MVDVLSQKQRSYCMSRIRSKNTSPEVMLRKCIFRMGLRYRVKTSLIGKPDIVFTKKRVVVFIDGCFWHGCPLHSKSPSTNIEYWSKKLSRNIERDGLVTSELIAQGWYVLRIWEHEIKINIEQCVQKIQDILSERE